MEVQSSCKKRKKPQKWQLVLLIIGSFTFAVTPFVHQLGLSASKNLSTGKVLLVAMAVVFMLIGLLGRKTVAAYKTLAILLLNTLLLLVAVEAMLLIAARLRDFFPRSSESLDQRDLRYVDDGREDLPYYRAQEWSMDYWREYKAAWVNRELPFEAYVLWRSAPFEGRTININRDGFRMTPGADCGPGAYTVFTFGGSTMWGTGVPDWGTIPAFLQSQVAASTDQPVCIVNVSEQAWVSTQSVVQLVQMLQSGNRPDLLIFYDGNNDAFAAYQSGVAGVPQNVNSIAARFENREEVPPLVSMLSKTRIYGFLEKLAQGANHMQVTPPYEIEGVGMNVLAEGITETYLGNVDVVNALAAQYNFEAYFFWQTILLVDEKPLTAEERSIRAVAIEVYPGYDDLYRVASRRIEDATAQYANLYYIVDVFRGQNELVFIDPFHVTIEGNEIVARTMLSIIQGE